MKLLPLLLLLACGPGPAPFSTETWDGPTSLEVRPADVSLETGPEGAAPVQFEAWATYGTEDPVRLDVVKWVVSNRSAGAIDEDGLFVPSMRNGGEAIVTATLDGVTGAAGLHVLYTEDVNPAGVDPEWFRLPELAADDPTAPNTDPWLYPPNDVVVPRNAPALQFMWQDMGARAYRLSFRSAITAIDVYSTDRTFIADNAAWTTMAATNAGGTVEVTLTASYSAGLRIQKPRRLGVNRLDASGSIIYWSTSRSGLIEIPYGLPARDFLTPNESGGHCVACHAVSRDGKVAFTYDGGNGSLGLKNVGDRSDVIPFGSGNTANFHTFSPEGDWLMSASRGHLLLFDARTGAYVSDVVPTGAATQPDWSADGDQVVYVSATERYEDWILGGSTTLYVMDHLGGGTFGAPRAILTTDGAWRAYYPAFSPDNQWIVFNRSTGDGYNDLDAELWVIAADGSGPAVRLDAANAGGNLTNSWPRWGPLPDDDILWLTFASTRPYGFVSPGNPQIWMTTFDPRLARQGLDPSTPASWLVNQDPVTNNHIPVWIE